MTNRTHILVLMLILGFAWTLVADVSSDDDPNMAFAFANLQGDSLLLLQVVPNPEQLSVAICSQGQKLDVHFEGEQLANINSQSPAEIAENFENLDGYLFKILNGRTIPDDICFLSAKGPLLDSQPLAINTTKNSACTSETIKAIETMRSRKVANCWQLAEIQDLGKVLLSELERNEVD